MQAFAADRIVACMGYRRVLLIGPLPRLIGGDSVATLNIARSRHWEDAGIELAVVNTGVKDRIRTTEERLGMGELLRFLRIMGECIGALSRAEAVLLWSNSRFLCTAGPFIILASRAARRPVFVKMFGTSLPEHLAKLPGLWRALVLSAIGKTRYALPETRALADNLAERWKVPRSRMLLFPNFIPDRDLERRPMRKRFTGNCVFVGQIREEKGVFDILDALGRRPDFRCDFYGPIIERDRSAFEAHLAGNGRARYRGIADPSSVVETMSAYDALLLPTHLQSEGYPGVLLQAFVAGVPVIASAWLSIPDLVADGATGILIAPNSPQAIVDALERLWRDEATYSSIAERAFASAERFSEKAVVRDILVKEVLDALARPSPR